MPVCVLAVPEAVDEVTEPELVIVSPIEKIGVSA